MPFFVIESEFTRPFNSFGAAVTAYRSYLDQGYAAGLMFCSGPQGRWFRGNIDSQG